MNLQELKTQLIHSRTKAKEWVYEIGSMTPLDSLSVEDVTCFLKREDISAINSYKWRGAYTKIRACLEMNDSGPFVAASAGNHAQGVALAAERLNVQATIFMPRSTPKLKQTSVARLGGANVTIELVGDDFQQASKAAQDFASQNRLTLVKPFDDIDIIAGQSTVADELILQQRDLDVVYLPIGGGGLASGVGFALKLLNPEIEVVGIEVIGQESMYRSVQSGVPTRLDEVDIFCDGTAVLQPGDLTHQICTDVIDRIELVSNEQVCAAIQKLWEGKRVLTEPSGAIALAGLIQDVQLKKVSPRETKCCAVLTGANTDFLTLPVIVGKSQLIQPTRCYYRFEIQERKGSLIELLDLLFEDINIVDFQYGKSGADRAYPVLGLYATQEQQDELKHKIKDSDISAIDVSKHQSSQFRVIPFRPDFTENALFLHVDFPDRPGALRELMREISDSTNICYFNFNDTGQIEGHALIGFEFGGAEDQSRFERSMAKLNFHYRKADLQGVFGDSVK